MDMKIILVVAIAIIVAGAGIYFYVYSGSASENEFILPGQDDNLKVTAKIDLELKFADGTSKTITGINGAPLTVEYDGQEVTSANWIMKAKADTPTGNESYDKVQINLNPQSAGYSETNFYLQSIVQYDTGDGQWRQHWIETSNAPTMVINVPVDDPSGEYTEVYSHLVTFSNVFSPSDNSDYAYKLVFNPGGYCIYRGSDILGDAPGPWQVVALGNQNMALEYPIDYINQQTTVSWDSEVIWS